MLENMIFFCKNFAKQNYLPIFALANKQWRDSSAG
jgi:hypothetical protein